MLKIPQRDNRDLYFIQQQEYPFHLKIGIAKDCEKRLKQLQTGSAIPLKIVHIFKGQAWREKEIHKELASYHRSGEWFACNRYSVPLLPQDLYEQLPEDALIYNNKQYIMGMRITSD